MQSVTRARRLRLALIMVGLLQLAFPLPALASEGGYLLLELEGYKVKWGDRRLGAGAIVSYAFAAEMLRFDDAHNCSDMAPIEALSGDDLSMETLTREAAEAFRVWERAANLTFHKVSDVRDADIIIGAHGQPRGRAFANVSYAPDPEEGVRAIEQALVCLNPDQDWKVGFDGNENVYDIRYTLIHEIGHAIGLDHPGPSGQVMAFRYSEAFDDLQPGDLRGVRQLYGLASRFAAQLAEKPAEAYQGNNLSDNSVMSTTERALDSVPRVRTRGRSKYHRITVSTDNLPAVGLLEQDIKNARLDLEPAEDTDAMPQLLGSSVF